MATRKTMALLSALITALVLGFGGVTGATETRSSSGVVSTGATAIPWSFGGIWEMDLQCEERAESFGIRSNSRDEFSDRAVRSIREPAGRPQPRLARAGIAAHAPSPRTDNAQPLAGHHEQAIAAGRRFRFEEISPNSSSEPRLVLTAVGQSAPLDPGWSASELRVAGAVALQDRVDCHATASQVLATIQQQDLLRVEGNVCLRDEHDGSEACHDHFVVIVARRHGTLGPNDRGQLVIFTFDAGGQYTTGRRIRSVNDAAAYGGANLLHLGASHSHEGTGD